MNLDTRYVLSSTILSLSEVVDVQLSDFTLRVWSNSRLCCWSSNMERKHREQNSELLISGTAGAYQKYKVLSSTYLDM